ncbi:hypothetical protein M406DRAFT_287220 [Cryphonectria parasitica EP155]|uniref:PhoD-like phosphatase domain-containing protein n=1 Tax=Cryphonectria parasitica (strain ATCC 38755 / EP155) TaxID=660469 RepID=A0A9P5CSY9_CRYP1|nr:uncharacterized protein M406DRAFT_287220 [Cryphonectria parasitica EP155]KAF3769127.1 hypothetical protein M406DRAFT_287220 [Cryphonectria parasitica EP155]
MTSHHGHARAHDPDAELFEDDEDLAVDPHNPYESSTRWRHEESSAYRKHASLQPRAAEAKTGTHDLADFLNSSRLAPDNTSRSRPVSAVPSKHMPIMVEGQAPEAAALDAHAEADAAHNHPKDGRTIACGPLLNYRRMEGTYWVGSVLIVTTGGGKTQDVVPTLALRKIDAAHQQAQTEEVSNGTDGHTNGFAGATDIEGLCLYSDPRNTFWRFDLRCEMGAAESKWAYTLPEMRFISKKKPQENFFNVPAVTESMRIMFHSCNGFSVGTDEAAWSGPALWNDVLRRHAEVPFHVMIGGGDQVYCDGIRVNGPLREWTAIANPKKRRDYPFPEKLRAECDDFYLKNYIRWYSTEPFASANGQIPQVNIFDDHDIIDGYGSYVDDFMKCDVFRGIGGCAFKYYMLFQHHLPPSSSTYTSDAPQTMTQSGDGQDSGLDPLQLVDTYVAAPMVESHYIVGAKPGPYMAARSHNVFARLGARIALVGIDARTERTRHRVNYQETYDLIFGRLTQELREAQAAGTPFKHLILLLGIPIAYPRLTWLENIFSSPIIGPIKFANRRFGLGGGLFNHFDGSVDLADDLDDHYTAKNHKKERNWMIETFQKICKQFSVRLTILGGDVHLAALGRFYSNPSLNIPCENDHRYMVNVVSSAIVNKPPPQAIANLLARRNKIHHLNHETDETLLKLFNKDPGDSVKTAAHNQVTMPSRNFAMLTENSPNNAPRAQEPRAQEPRPQPSSQFLRPHNVNGHLPIQAGETGCGTTHKAAHPTEHGQGNDGSLDICFRVEIDQHDPQGRTENYGLTVPTLTMAPGTA